METDKPVFSAIPVITGVGEEELVKEIVEKVKEIREAKITNNNAQPVDFSAGFFSQIFDLHILDQFNPFCFLFQITDHIFLIDFSGYNANLARDKWKRPILFNCFFNIDGYNALFLFIPSLAVKLFDEMIEDFREIVMRCYQEQTISEDNGHNNCRIVNNKRW